MPERQISDLITHPDQFLDEVQQEWLRPLSGVASGASWMLYRTNWVAMRGLFRLTVAGADSPPFMYAMMKTCLFVNSRSGGWARCRETLESLAAQSNSPIVREVAPQHPITSEWKWCWGVVVLTENL
ncbi:MAG: hypothetical protein ABI614_07160 [Planctomycetota bacterium]